MSDLLIIAGTAALVLSVILVIAALARTEPPRAGAVAFVVGVAALMAGAWIDPTPFRAQDVGASWQRLLTGSLRF